MEENKHLHILWTNADPLTAHQMVMMYAVNSLRAGWWDQVTVIIWGATAKYVAEDKDIQERIRAAMHVGVKFTACIACAVNLGVREKMEELGVELKPWGEPLTELLQRQETILTV